MNLLAFVRRKLLLSEFLTADELTQAQYELITDPNANAKEIFELHDELMGGNLSACAKNFLDSGPFICLNSAQDEGPLPDNGEDENSAESEPTPVGLTSCSG